MRWVADRLEKAAAAGPNRHAQRHLLRPGGRLVMYGLSENSNNGVRDLPATLKSLLRMPLATMPWWKSLMMMNGPLVKRACGTEPGSFLYKVAAEPKLSNQDRIEYLYKAALARSATGMEVAAANRLVLKRKGNTAEALQDVWWALLNSNEFILNH